MTGRLDSSCCRTPLRNGSFTCAPCCSPAKPPSSSKGPVPRFVPSTCSPPHPLSPALREAVPGLPFQHLDNQRRKAGCAMYPRTLPLGWGSRSPGQGQGLSEGQSDFEMSRLCRFCLSRTRRLATIEGELGTPGSRASPVLHRRWAGVITGQDVQGFGPSWNRAGVKSMVSKLRPARTWPWDAP